MVLKYDPFPEEMSSCLMKWNSREDWDLWWMWIKIVKDSLHKDLIN